MSRTGVPVAEDARTGHTHARLIRGVAAGALATFVALFSHVAGGGHVPSHLGVVLPLVLAVFVSVVLAGRRLSLLRLSASVGISQALFHGIFTAAASAAPGAGAAVAQSAAAGATHAHHHGAGVPADFAAAVTAGTHGSHAAGQSSPLMLLTHTAAALVTIAVLHRSETILVSLVRLLRMVSSLLRPLLRVPAPLVVVGGRRLAGPVDTVLSPAPLGVVQSARVDRGPPAFALAA